VQPAQSAYGERGRSARHLTRLVSVTPAGRDVAVTVMRDGKRNEMHLKPEAGVLVATVQKNSTAAKAGLKAGDGITAVDGHNVTSPGELIRARPAGDGSHNVNLMVVRDKKELKITATLDADRARRPARRGTPA